MINFKFKFGDVVIRRTEWDAPSPEKLTIIARGWATDAIGQTTLIYGCRPVEIWTGKSIFTEYLPESALTSPEDADQGSGLRYTEKLHGAHGKTYWIQGDPHIEDTGLLPWQRFHRLDPEPSSDQGPTD